MNKDENTHGIQSYNHVVTDRHASVAWSVQLVYVLRSDSVLSTYDRSSAVDFPPFG